MKKTLKLDKLSIKSFKTTNEDVKGGASLSCYSYTNAYTVCFQCPTAKIAGCKTKVL